MGGGGSRGACHARRRLEINGSIGREERVREREGCEF